MKTYTCPNPACGSEIFMTSITSDSGTLPCPNCGARIPADYDSESGVWSVGIDPEVLRPTNILLQAVVERGDRMPEGDLIEAVAPAWLEIVRLIQKDPGFLYKIDPRKLEEIIAGAYERAGFDSVVRTPRSGDLGRDVIAVKHGRWSVRFLDQVKAYRPGRLVTANDVRAMLGVIQADQNTSKGVITTTSDFAPRIKEDLLLKPYLPHRIELINGSDLIEHLSSIAGH